MREIRLSGSMSGRWKRGPGYRATSRLYPTGGAGQLQCPTPRGQVHVFGQRFSLKATRFDRKMDQTPDFAVVLTGGAYLRRGGETVSYCRVSPQS